MMNTGYKKVIWDYVHLTYGTVFPIQFVGRLEDEMAAIPSTGFLDDMVLCRELRDAAKKEGCEIDVALTFGSSLLNWVWRSSGTNPLPPHYRCLECGRTEFVPDVKDGFDLPEKTCCGEPMLRCGHQIPFESLLPNIDERGTDLEIRIPGSFAPTAIQTMGDFFEKHGEYRMVVVATGREEPEPVPCLRFVLIPVDDPISEHEGDDSWKSDPYFLYKGKNYRTVTLVLSEEKEQLKKLAAKYEDAPFVDELLVSPILSVVKKSIEKRIADQGRPLLQMGDLCFSSLLSLHGYERSTYADDNPVLSTPEARYSDMFSCREEVWDLLMNATNREFKIGSGLATKITEFTRSGRFSDNRMPASTERLLLAMGIPDLWITQMKTTLYLPPKADLINTLMDELKLAWYDLNT